MSKKKFEDLIYRLEEISELLDDESVGLDKSVELYEEGLKLSKECYSRLKNAELKVSELKSKLESDINTDQ